MREMTWNEKAAENTLIVRCMSARAGLKGAQEALRTATTATERKDAQNEVNYWTKRIPQAQMELSAFQAKR